MALLLGSTSPAIRTPEPPQAPLLGLPGLTRTLVPPGCNHLRAGQKFALLGTEAAGSPWTPRRPGSVAHLLPPPDKLGVGQWNVLSGKLGALSLLTPWIFTMVWGQMGVLGSISKGARTDPRTGDSQTGVRVVLTPGTPHLRTFPNESAVTALLSLSSLVSLPSLTSPTCLRVSYH